MNSFPGTEHIPRSVLEHIKRAEQEDAAAMRELRAREIADDPGCDCEQHSFTSNDSVGVQLIAYNVSTGLIKGCHFCGTVSNLSRCGGCKVVYYCGQAHQTIDRAAHKTSCSKIKKERVYLEAQEVTLRGHAGDMDTPPNAFKKGSEADGHFWGYHGTRPYMRARYPLIDAILTANTARAVEEALEHCLEMLDLNHNDNQGIRGYIPPLYLRLERNQECYDFVKWWIIDWDDGYEWGDPRGQLKNQLSTERDLDLLESFGPLSHLVSLTLLHIRQFLSLASELNADGASAMHRKAVEEDEKRARELAIDAYAAVHCANKHFWGVLLDPMDLLTMRPDSYKMGSFQQVPGTLQQCYNSWAETPGAFDVVREMKGWEEVQRALKAKENVCYVTI